MKQQSENCINVFIAENKGACISLVGKYISENTSSGPVGPVTPPSPGGEPGVINIITTGSTITPSESNVYSALRSRKEFLCKNDPLDQYVEGSVIFEEDVTINENNTVHGKQTIRGLQTLHKGFETSEYTNSGNQIYGAQLTEAGIFTVAGIRTMSFETYELLYNVIRAQGGKMVISNAATIESCKYILQDGSILEPSKENSYDVEGENAIRLNYVELTIKKDEYNLGKIPFRYGDILYGYVNSIGNSGQYAKGGECTMYVITSDSDIDRLNLEGSMTIKAKLFEVGNRDDEHPLLVPGNILPVNTMAIAQRGNIHGTEGRTSSFFIDATTANLYMLDNVTTPTIYKNQYGILLGKMPDDLYKEVQESFSYILPTDPVVYAKYGIFENFLQFNHLGQPVATANYRGIWNYSTATSKTDYYRRTKTLYDTVTYDGSLWACVGTQPLKEPSTDRPGDWTKQVSKGDEGKSIKIKGTLESDSDLPDSPDNPSDAYIIGGYLYIWVEELNEWNNVGKFSGENQYTHIAYANFINFDSEEERAIVPGSFSTSTATGRRYIGFCVDFVKEDPSEEFWKSYTWKISEGKRGDFKSMVFRRSDTTLTSEDTPIGGTYDDPWPILSNGIKDPNWHDGIPSGNGPIYSSVRVFKDDEETTWSAPKLMLDSVDFEVIYSPNNFESISDAKKSIPSGFKKTNVEIDENWLIEASEKGWYDEDTYPNGTRFEALWMATISRSAGTEWNDDSWTVTHIKGEKGDPGKNAGPTYSLIPSVNAIYISKDLNVSVDAVSIKIGQTTPDGYSEITRKSVLNELGLELYYYIDNNSEKVLETDINSGIYSNIKVYNHNEQLVYILKEKDNPNIILGIFIIPFIREGQNGEDPYFADINNELDSIALDYLGYSTKNTKLKTTVSIFKGIEELNITKLEYSIYDPEISETKNSLEGWEFTLKKDANNLYYTGEVIIDIAAKTNVKEKTIIYLTVYADSISRKLTFTINGVKAGAKGEDAIIYKLVPTATQIISREGLFYPDKITCQAYAIQGENYLPIENSIIKYSIDGVEKEYNGPINSKDVGSILEFILYVNNEIKDRETIGKITSGKDGADIYANIIKNSNFDNTSHEFKYWEEVSNTVVIEKEVCNGYNAITCNNNSAVVLLKTTTPKLLGNSYYTLSFYYKNTSTSSDGYTFNTIFYNSKNIIDSISSSDDLNTISNNNYSIYFGPSDTWRKVYITFRCNQEESIQFGFYKPAATSKLSISQIKFELGEVATPYIKNQEDLAGERGPAAFTLYSIPSYFSILTDAETGLTLENRQSKIVIAARDPFRILSTSEYKLDFTSSTNNNINIVPTGFSNSEGYEYYFEVEEGVSKEDLPEYVTIKYTDLENNRDMGTLTIPIIIAERGLTGKAGEGAMLVPYGNYNSAIAYKLIRDTNNTVVGKPIVYYKKDSSISEGNYFVLNKDIPGDSTNIENIGINNSEYWTKFQEYKAIYTEAIMADYAKFGDDNGAIFFKQFMFSQKGQGNKDYSYFLPDNSEGNKPIFTTDKDGNYELSGSFNPKLHLDFLNGLANLSCLCEPYVVPEAKDGVIKLSMESGFNVKIPWSEHRPIIVLPNLKDEPSWLKNGSHVEIMYESGGYGFANHVSSNIYNNPAQAKSEFLLICVENPCKEPEGIETPSYEWKGSNIMCRGKRAQYLILGVGGYVRFRAVEIGENTYWYVTNEGNVTEEKVDVYSRKDGEYVGLNSEITYDEYNRVQFYGAEYSLFENMLNDQEGGGPLRGLMLYCGTEGLCPKNIVFTSGTLEDQYSVYTNHCRVLESKYIDYTYKVNEGIFIGGYGPILGD